MMTLTRPLPRARREVKKPKKPKVKKPKVTGAEVAVLIDAENLVARLFEISIRPRQTSRPRQIPIKNEIL
jgi:heme-binding NEAT domain protein